MFDDRMSRALRAIAEMAAREQDADKLCQLILDINLLLDVIEKRVAEMGEHSDSSCDSDSSSTA